MAASEVLGSHELLEKVLGSLTRWEAAGLLGVSRRISGLAARLVGGGACRPRLVVACSGSSTLVEVDPLTCRVVTALRTGRKQRPRAGSWVTGIAFGPHDGHLYLSQYNVGTAKRRKSGVELYHGRTLAYMKIFASGTALARPEGLAFVDGCLFVASAEHSSVVRVSLDGRVLESIALAGLRSAGRDVGALAGGVPWTLAPGFLPGQLFAAYDLGFVQLDGQSYGDAPDTRQGALLELLRQPGGGWRLTASGEGVSRPSGLHVRVARGPDGRVVPEQCRINLTASHEPLLAISYGAFLRGAAFERPMPGLEGLSPGDKLWDGVLVGRRLLCSVHTSHTEHRSRLQCHSLDGRLEARMESACMVQPNNMALQH